MPRWMKITMTLTLSLQITGEVPSLDHTNKNKKDRIIFSNQPRRPVEDKKHQIVQKINQELVVIVKPLHLQ